MKSKGGNSEGGNSEGGNFGGGNFAGGGPESGSAQDREKVAPAADAKNVQKTATAQRQDVPWWAATADDVTKRLETDSDTGLTDGEAARRLTDQGPNELPTPPPLSLWRLLLPHFQGPIVLLMFAAIVISTVAWAAEGASGVPIDALVIAAILVVNGLIGLAQEHKAEQAIAALQALIMTEASVVRNGRPGRIPAREVVPGDLILLGEGDLIPADARIVEASSLFVAEAGLTGESTPVPKSVEAGEVDLALGDRSSMAHGGTAVVSGRGRAIVTGTGSKTEVGRIATLLGEIESEPTPLQREIDRVGRLLGVTVVCIGVVIVGALLLVNRPDSVSDLVNALLIGVALAVAAVPEGLPAMLSIVLALGVQRMSKLNALVKRLASVETLGSATIICSDKTGTLTRNEMTARRLVVSSADVEITGTGYGPNGDLLVQRAPLEPDSVVLGETRRALSIAGLTSDASITELDGDYSAVGDPTEAALLAAQPKAGLDPEAIDRRFERVIELPFLSERKWMAVVAEDRNDGTLVMTVKGAPDVLLDHCSRQWQGGEAVPMTDHDRDRWGEAIERLSGQALRTLAVASRPVSRTELDQGADLDLERAAEDGLTLAGIFGIIDPPRDEARQAISLAGSAGIRVIMITGDHPSTALQIALELGIVEPGAMVASAADIESADDDELLALARSTSVYARVAPEHKLRIVHALIRSGEIVAMTGDGVNDAPALKAADIGVAMGVTGTEVSKQAADLILADDNFATIVDAVNEGRAIFHNIRSFLRYLLSSNVGEVLTIFGGVLAAGWIGLTETSEGGVASPLLAVQILWVNLVTDAAPALALGVDPPQKQLMEVSPRRPEDRIIDWRMWRGIGVVGLTMAVATLAMFDLRLPGGFVEGSDTLIEARTSAFTVLVLAQLFNTVNARSDSESAFRHLTANRWLGGAVLLSLLLHIAVVHVGFLQEAFGTVALSPTDWLLATVLASSVVFASEARKLLLRRSTS